MSKNAIIDTPRLTHLGVLYVVDKGRYIFLIIQGVYGKYFCYFAGRKKVVSL